MEEELLTVAAVARRLGVAPATLRTWDRRYGLGPSTHEAGEHRRYCPQDLAILTAMRKLITAGVAPAEAAAQAKDFKGKISVEKIVDNFEVREDLVEALADKGFDPQFGARPVKRVIQKDVLNELNIPGLKINDFYRIKIGE